MLSRTRASVQRFIMRATIALMLVGALVPVAAGPPAPARAEHTVDHQPVARLELEIKEVYIHDDRDWGEGDIKLNVRFWEVADGCKTNTYDSWRGRCVADLATSADITFGALDRETVEVNRVFPGEGDWAANTWIAPKLGIPVYAGRTYGWEIKAVETDPLVDDELGDLVGWINQENGWGPLGTYKERGWRNDTLTACGRAVPVACKPAHFTVEYEIRHVAYPLPDLRAVDMSVYDLVGTPKKLVCATVENVESVDVGAFEVALQVNGAVPPGGRATAGRLQAGQKGDLCVEVTLPASGEQRLRAVVDEPGGLTERNETNNFYEMPYSTAPTGTGAPEASTTDAPETSTKSDPEASPTSEPTSGKADLTISTIKINGQAPDGKADCKDGKNTVTVLVKNAGTSNAENVAVRLVVDGAEDDAMEQTVKSLGAGKEQEVRFGDVKLKKGEHQVTVQVGADGNAAEANNQQTVTVGCKSGIEGR